MERQPEQDKGIGKGEVEMECKGDEKKGENDHRADTKQLFKELEAKNITERVCT